MLGAGFHVTVSVVLPWDDSALHQPHISFGGSLFHHTDQPTKQGHWVPGRRSSVACSQSWCEGGGMLLSTAGKRIVLDTGSATGEMIFAVPRE